jgi:hypothetical protein
MVSKKSPKVVSKISAAVLPLTIFGMEADREVIFSDHRGNHRPAIEKRQRKLIAKSAFVKFFLKSEERLRCLTTGYSPVRLMEKIFAGPALPFFKRAIFIFTDRRILHIPTRFNGTPHSTVSQIAYADCAAIELKGHTLSIRYKNGRIENFSSIGRPERKRLKSILTKLTLPPKEANRVEQRIHLCPSCGNPLKGDSGLCLACKLRFKTKSQALLRAILIPGGGYFFSHHNFFGTVIAVLESILFVATAVMWSSYLTGQPVAWEWLSGPVAAIILIKWIAAYHAKMLIADRMPSAAHFVPHKV